MQKVKSSPRSLQAWSASGVTEHHQTPNESVASNSTSPSHPSFKSDRSTSGFEATSHLGVRINPHIYPIGTSTLVKHVIAQPYVNMNQEPRVDIPFMKPELVRTGSIRL